MEDYTMKKISYIFAGILLVLAGCSKVAETDAPISNQVVHPDGMIFQGSLSSLTKSYFGDASNPGQLYWEETDKVAIYGVPITGTKDSGWDDYIFDWTNMVSGLATVEVNASDPTKAIFHTTKNADQWLGEASQMMFFAIYPATEVPQIVRDEERDETNFLLTIPRDQDGVHFGRYQIMCSTTLMYEASDITSGTVASFRPFSPGGTVLAFNVKNATSNSLEISKIKIINVNGETTSYPEPLTGAQSLFIDYAGGDPDEGPEAECGADPNSGDVYYDVNLNLETPLTLAAGETSGKYYAAVGHVYLNITSAYGDYDEETETSTPSDLAKAYVRVEALDNNDSVLASAERAFPHSVDEHYAGLAAGVRYDFTVNLEAENGYHFMIAQQPGSRDGNDSGLIRSYKVVDGTASYVDWSMDAIFADIACTEQLDNSIIKSYGIDSHEFNPDTPTVAFPFDFDKANNNSKPWVATSRSFSPSWNSSVGSTESYYNLSNTYGDSSIQNTANCYVINAPGYYTFPCVLGNGIKDGAPNPGAWTATGTTSHPSFIAKLKDYMDGDIASPYVHNSSASVVSAPTSACIIWEDVDGLIDASSYQLDAPVADVNGIYWIKFHIDPANIAQGNAVIAVKDANGIVMWSWHIWVTPFRFGENNNDDLLIDTKTSDSALRFAPVNLGFVEQESLESIIQDDETLYIRLKQDESNKTVLVKLTSAGGSYYPSGNVPAKGYSPLWQYGRKDPMIPGDPATASNIPVYGTAANFSIRVFPEANTTPENVPFSLSIRNPEKLIIACEDESHTQYSFTYKVFNNLWNMTAEFGSYSLTDTDVPQRKSVYDPTPVGYQVPQPSDYYHFYTPEYPEADFSKIVVRSWNDQGLFAYGHGRTGYNNPERFGALTFFPFTGSRYHANGGAISPVSIKWPDDYTLTNLVGMGMTNNRENSNGSPIGIHYFTYSYSAEEIGGEIRYTYAFGPDYPLIYTETPTGAGCNDASGFIRPVVDRSTSYDPPLSFDGNGAGSYNDVNL